MSDLQQPQSARDGEMIAGVIHRWMGREAPFRVRSRLVGRSNRSYHVEVAPSAQGAGAERGSTLSVVVRLPGEREFEAVDRPRELRAHLAAAGAGVAPRILHEDTPRGVLVTEYVEGVRALLAPELSHGVTRRAVCEALASLHALPRIGESLEPLAALDVYAVQVERTDAPEDLPMSLSELVARARDLAATLSKAPPAPCHGDLNPGNVIVAGDGSVRFVDFEYAIDADPNWDLAELAASSHLDARATRAFLRDYAGARARHRAENRGVLLDLENHRRWRVFAHALAGMWALAAGDRSLASERLGACASVLQSGGDF